MIRNSTEILDYKNLLQSKIEHASMLVFWLENEETFWEWMVIQDSSKGNYW